MEGTEDGRTKEGPGIFGPYYTILYGKYKTSERHYFHPLLARSTVPLRLSSLKFIHHKPRDLSFRPFWCMIKLAH
jgi:hypothetical protein